MKKRMIIALLLGMAATVFAAPQTTCPVMGGKINRSLYVDAEGFRIYVCCGGCIGKVKADPAKYIKQLKAKGVELEKVPEIKGAAASKKVHDHPAH